MKRIQFNFRAPSSHSHASKGFESHELTKFVEGEFFSKSTLFGYQIKTAAIQVASDGYEIVVEFESDIDENEALSFVENLASLLTFRLSYDTAHHNGSPYIDVDYGDFFRNNHEAQGEGVHFHEHLSIKATREVNLTNFFPAVPDLHELLHFYFLGMKSNNAKAKYFNLFLILEALEISKLSTSLSRDDSLFKEDEIVLIRDMANKMNDSRKKSAILGVLNRTDTPRHIKLFNVLQGLGITAVTVLPGSSINLTEDLVKDLVNTRNKLFHKGNAVDEKIIWLKLLPLTREVVAKLLKEPSILSPDAQ